MGEPLRENAGMMAANGPFFDWQVAEIDFLAADEHR